VILLCTSSLLGQYQANTAEATLTVNGVNGSPPPNISVPIHQRTTATIVVSGGANVLFDIMVANKLTFTPIPTPYGSFDLDLNSARFLMGGQTDQFGNWSTTVWFQEAEEPIVTTAAIQALVITPGELQPFKLSAATSVMVLEITGDRETLSFSGQGPSRWAQINLNSNTLESNMELFPIMFYGIETNRIWISPHGFITTNENFANSGNNPAKPTFYMTNLNGFPIIAPYWGRHDIFQTATGRVDIILDRTDPNNHVVIFEWIDVGDMLAGWWAGGMGVRDFSVSIDQNGVITLKQEIFGAPSIANWIVGISSGTGLDPLGRHQTDLSVAGCNQYQGLPFEGLYEGFGGMNIMFPRFGLLPAHLWDLATYEIVFTPVEPDSYIISCVS